MDTVSPEEKARANEQKAERRLKREQKALHNEFLVEYERIKRLTATRATPEISALIGTTPEKLLPYIRGSKPVTAAQIEKMKTVRGKSW